MSGLVMLGERTLTKGDLNMWFKKKPKPDKVGQQDDQANEIVRNGYLKNTVRVDLKYESDVSLLKTIIALYELDESPCIATISGSHVTCEFFMNQLEQFKGLSVTACSSISYIDGSQILALSLVKKSVRLASWVPEEQAEIEKMLKTVTPEVVNFSEYAGKPVFSMKVDWNGIEFWRSFQYGKGEYWTTNKISPAIINLCTGKPRGNLKWIKGDLNMSVPNQIIKDKFKGLYTVRLSSGHTGCMELTVATLNELTDLAELRIIGDSDDCSSFLRTLLANNNVTNRLFCKHSDNCFTGFEQNNWREIYLSVVRVEQKQQQPKDQNPAKILRPFPTEDFVFINLEPHTSITDTVNELLSSIKDTCTVDLIGTRLTCRDFIKEVDEYNNGYKTDKLYDWLCPTGGERHLTILVTKQQQPDETILSKLAKVENELGIRITGFECK